MAFLFKKKGHSEQERIANIESELDQNSIACLERIGIESGSICVEIGAGGGSLSKWLAARVGDAGHVFVTDVQTKYLERIDANNVTVRQLDISKDPLKPREYDLVVARKVLEHLADPTAALQKMYNGLRPGGCLYVEDTDLITLNRVSTQNPFLFNRVYSAFIDLMIASGFNPTLGAELGDELRALGLESVKMEGRTTEWNGSDQNPAGALYRSTFQRLRKRLTEATDLDAKDVDHFLAEIQSADFHAMTSIHFTAWGFRAAKIARN